MIIIKIYGGVGNQMFQYAFGRALSIMFNQNLVIDKSYFEKKNYPVNLHSYYPYKLDLYNITCKFMSKNLNKYIKVVRRKKLYYITNLIVGLPILKRIFPKFLTTQNFNLSHFERSNLHYLEGHWQKYDFIEDYRNIIISELKIKNVEIRNQALLNQIQNSNSVSVHFRLGDYVSNPIFSQTYAKCTMSYYEKALHFINENSKNTIFFLFSNDIKWVKENIIFPYNVVFVDSNESDEGELYLMTKCKHNIIANSSFSWWGAWLNENPNKIVVAPNKWFNDPSRKGDIYYPRSWSVLPNEEQNF